MERWPSLRIPDYMEGVFTLDAGITNVKNALNGFKSESEKLGAHLKYNSFVKHIDHANGKVTLESGETFTAKQIVVTCGAQTNQFY